MSAKRFLVSFFSLLVFALLVINLFHFSYETDPVTITSTLKFLSTTGSTYQIPSINELVASFSIVGDWGIFDGFRLFLNGLGSILGTVAWVVSSLIFTLTFAVQLMFFVLG